jgi:hypothetical protein
VLLHLPVPYSINEDISCIHLDSLRATRQGSCEPTAQ